MDWTQQEEESPLPALQMFDEKSASTLREVSISQEKGNPEIRILELLDRSKNSLTNLSLNLYTYKTAFRLKIIEIASNSYLLESLVFWPFDEFWVSRFPKTRLTRSCSQVSLDATRPNNLQVLWYWDSFKDWKSKEDVLSSLVSFADPGYQDPTQFHSFISNFTKSIIHLAYSFRHQDMLTSLSCPNLSVLEGEFPSTFPSWLDAPNLRIVIAESFTEETLLSLPVTIEELWLFQFHASQAAGSDLNSLLKSCPNLKILKVGPRFVRWKGKQFDLIMVLKARREKILQGVEIQGVKMKSLEKLVIPTKLFKTAELNELKSLVGAMIDINDHPAFIELEY